MYTITITMTRIRTKTITITINSVTWIKQKNQTPMMRLSSFATGMDRVPTVTPPLTRSAYASCIATLSHAGVLEAKASEASHTRTKQGVHGYRLSESYVSSLLIVWALRERDFLLFIEKWIPNL